MRRSLRSAVALSVSLAALALTPRAAHADEERESEESVAMQANLGLKIGLGPTLLLPLRDGGPFGGGLTLDGRYGIKAGPTALAPGGRLAGYLISGRFVGIAMPTFRVTLPVGPLAPFVMGGIGAGYISNDSESGVALLGGGGLMIHVGRIFAFGAEATYQVITGTEMKTFAIGPAISFGG
jgi:hypothetical protein